MRLCFLSGKNRIFEKPRRKSFCFHPPAVKGAGLIRCRILTEEGKVREKRPYGRWYGRAQMMDFEDEGESSEWV